MFTIIKTDKKSRARLGVLKTPHGVIRTPAYVIVATHAQVRALKPGDIKKTKTQVVIANTYHLWDSGNVHRRLGVRMPMMTDSGGFQVFSFGAAKEHGVGKVLKQPVFRHLPKSKIKITEKGVYFTLDGRQRFLSPELSIAIQEKLGADIIFAFDECTSPLHPYDYNKKAMERTHRWAVRCLLAHRSLGEGGKAKKRKDQLLFGIIQGGRFNKLRAQSAKFIGSLPFGGFGIGGSFGQDEMVRALGAVVPHLPEGKPRHLLGIGRIEDIFNAVESGIDTFDCVIPTREARHARIWTARGPYDIRKSRYRTSKTLLEPGCKCPICSKGVSRSRMRALFKTKNPDAGRFATLHNVWFFNRLMEKIREALARGRFTEFKRAYIRQMSAPTRR
jgi:queuine tRNA-ribosyltransferase/7-cyano-7-deazaguanine tRNA-ribosyltransferase